MAYCHAPGHGSESFDHTQDKFIESEIALHLFFTSQLNLIQVKYGLCL